MSTTIGKGSDDSSDDSLKKPSTISETQKESFNQDDNDDNGSVDLHDDGHKMRSGQGWGRGIVADVKRTIGTHWKEEMVNLNSKVCHMMFDVYCMRSILLRYHQYQLIHLFSMSIISLLQYCRLLHAHSFYTLRVSLLLLHSELSTARQPIIILVLLK